jgi:hypothetical protein
MAPETETPINAALLTPDVSQGTLQYSAPAGKLDG